MMLSTRVRLQSQVLSREENGSCRKYIQTEKGSDQDKMQSCALNAGDNLCTDSMKDFFEIGCNIMDNMAHKFNPHINI